MLLAFDFGGTKHTVGLVERGGKEWAGRQVELAPAGANAQKDLEITFRLARNLLGTIKPEAIGVSFGGPVDSSTGTVRLSHHVPGWETVSLGEILEEAFGAPAAVDNDANVGALGEWVYGAGVGCDHLCYITVSTGVGSGWILNRKIWGGADGMAGELGHMVIDPAGPECLCGKKGCVERLASGPYMVSDLRSLLMEGGMEAYPELWERFGPELENLSGKSIAAASAAGSEAATNFLDRSAHSIGTAIGNAANLVNPERFILGGGVTKSGQRYWDVLMETARKTALPEVRIDIVPAQLGDDAPLWGAAALASTLLSI